MHLVFYHDLERDNHIETLNRLPLPHIAALAPGAEIDRLARDQQILYQEDTSLAGLQGHDWQAAWREAAIRLDAAVLDAYGLSSETQRQLLDEFGNWRRPVVFEFRGYFPEHFNDVLTLSDFVKIEYDWEETNDRRRKLIEKKHRGRSLNKSERSELRHLQHLADLVVRLKAPYPIDEAETFLNKMKGEREWSS